MKQLNRPILRVSSWIVTVALWLSLTGPAMAEPNINDGTITSAVETELMLDQGVPAHRIDVKTVDGVVTLSGSVYNLLAKERALQVAESIKGVKSVVNLVEVKPVRRTDTEIRNDVILALALDPVTDSYKLDVQVQDGTAILKGTVDSHTKKDLCADVTMGVKGIKAINNELKVNFKTNRPDSEIKPEIERSLNTDVRMDHYDIDVEVNNGHVTLTGTVGSAAEKTLARTIAWVAGVRSVDANGLKVQWWARDEQQRDAKYVSKPDNEIKQAVTSALVNDPRVWSFNVGVDVTYGSVTLTGTVNSWNEYRRAAEDAYEGGASKVINELRVM